MSCGTILDSWWWTTYSWIWNHRDSQIIHRFWEHDWTSAPVSLESQKYNPPVWAISEFCSSRGYQVRFQNRVSQGSSKTALPAAQATSEDVWVHSHCTLSSRATPVMQSIRSMPSQQNPAGWRGWPQSEDYEQPSRSPRNSRLNKAGLAKRSRLEWMLTASLSRRTSSNNTNDWPLTECWSVRSRLLSGEIRQLKPRWVPQ